MLLDREVLINSVLLCSSPVLCDDEGGLIGEGGILARVAASPVMPSDDSAVDIGSGAPEYVALIALRCENRGLRAGPVSRSPTPWSTSHFCVILAPPLEDQAIGREDVLYPHPV